MMALHQHRYHAATVRVAMGVLIVITVCLLYYNILTMNYVNWLVCGTKSLSQQQPFGHEAMRSSSVKPQNACPECSSKLDTREEAHTTDLQSSHLQNVHQYCSLFQNPTYHQPCCGL